MMMIRRMSTTRAQSRPMAGQKAYSPNTSTSRPKRGASPKNINLRSRAISRYRGR